MSIIGNPISAGGGGQGVYIGSTAPEDVKEKVWIDTSTGMVVDSSFVFGNTWDITLLASGWTLSSGSYVQTVNALGLDHHFVLMGWIENPTPAQAQAYSYFTDIKSDADGTVTVVSSVQPSVNVPIRVKYHESTEQKTFDDFALWGSTDHRNLLDNGWFTVNQRGVTASGWTAGNYGVDRWYKNTACTVSSISASGITVTGTASYNGNLYQRFETGRIESGKTYTLSAIVNGTVVHGSAIFSNLTTATTVIYDDTSFSLSARKYDDYYEVIAGAKLTASVTIKAIKLELGSVSTLANDTTPNYAEELYKCQYYYQDLTPTTGNNNRIAFGSVASTTEIRMGMPVPRRMRTNTPSLVMDLTKVFFPNVEGTPSAVYMDGFAGNTALLRFTVSSATNGMPVMLGFYYGIKISLSADL